MADDITDRLVFRCHNRWADLTPRGAGRHCAECDTTVIDLSRLTRREALRRTAKGACVRLRYDAEGAPIFRAEPTRRGGLVVAAALLGGCASAPDASPAPPVARFESPPPEGDPLAPIPIAEGVALADLEDLAALEDDVRAWRYEDGPTAEQLALTAAKQSRRRVVAFAPQPVPHPYPQPSAGTGQPVVLEDLGMFFPD
ncbi:MAG: hypothetical protein H6719_23455 [Sandaracinaceae bacterium]|nr:hypothetical protein [Sandaracinaceae bacterium]